MRVGLLAGLLVLALRSGAMAQEPSVSPPPWLGGRVEMPELGFSFTLPDDWVAFDTSVDSVSQLEAASDFLGSGGRPVDDAKLAEAFTLAATSGGDLVLAHAASTSKCQIGASRVTDVPIEGYADLMYGAMVDEPRSRDVEPPQRIDLPAGAAYLVRASRQPDPGVDVWGSMVGYLLASDEVVLVLGCTTDDASPDDAWRSIAETIELEGGPPDTPSDIAETLVRVEVPEAAAALALPGSWTVDIEMLELSRVELEEGQLITTSILVAYPPSRLPSCGFFMQEVSPATVVGPAWPTVWLEAAGTTFPAEDDVYTKDPLDLPVGAAEKVAYEGRFEPELPLIDFVEYHIAADGRGLVFFCFTTPSLAPDDDWLSIAETIEFLPAEE